MPPFDDLVRTPRSYMTRAQFLGNGYNDRDLRTAVRTGLLTRLRHGIYVFTAEHALLTPEQKHVVLAQSVADRLGPAVAISHQSACAIHGFAMYGHDLSQVHVTRLDGSAGRTEHGIVHHVGQIVTDDDVEQIDGVLVVKSARAVFEAATVGSVESGIVLMDSALHLGTVTREQLLETIDRRSDWQGARRARYSLSLADRRAESPGESRSRFLFRREGLPIPELQVPVYDGTGRLVGFSDFGWIEYRHLGEFDGLSKYGGIADDPRTPQQVVIAEKTREDRMRSQQLGMSRWTWADLSPSRASDTAKRVGGEMEQSRRLYTRGRIHIPLN